MPLSPLHVNYSKPKNKNSLSHTHSCKFTHLHATTSLHTPIHILYIHLFIYYKYSGTDLHAHPLIYIYTREHDTKHRFTCSYTKLSSTFMCHLPYAENKQITALLHLPWFRTPTIMLIYFTPFSQILMSSLMNLTSKRHHGT